MKKVIIINADGTKTEGVQDLTPVSKGGAFVGARSIKHDVGVNGKEAWENRVELQFTSHTVLVEGELKDFLPSASKG